MVSTFREAYLKSFRKGDLLRLTSNDGLDMLVIYLQPCGCGEKSHIKVHPLFEGENEVIYDIDALTVVKVGHTNYQNEP